jgi:hypothetical protein
MAVPAGSAARPNDEILMKDLRLALRLQRQLPVGPCLMRSWIAPAESP